MWMNLLDNSTTANNKGSFILPLVLIGLVVVMMVFNSRSQKKRREEQKNMLDAIQPGNKVKTIGGICGVVVEVCAEDNTFIMETGSETSGKSYLKFDKQAVYQTDAKPAESAPVEEVQEVPTEEVFEETPAEAPVEENTEE